MLPITAPPLPPDDPALDIDARIRLAEQRIVARDAAFRARLSEAGTRLHAATQPKRWLAPVAGVVFAGVALVWMLRSALRGRERPAQVTQGRSGQRLQVPDTGRELPWVTLVGLAWPLLPQVWRNRISPTAATTAMTVGLPLLQRFVAGGEHRPLPTMAQVNLARFAGTWHEIARLPAPFEGACESQPTATYRPRLGGTLKVINRCRKDGRMVTSTGVARTEPGSGNARLEVSLWPAFLRVLPIAWAKYWILHVDDGYETAVVGHPNRRFLWILSRTPTLPPARLQSLVDLAAARGFPVERLRYVQPH